MIEPSFHSSPIPPLFADRAATPKMKRVLLICALPLLMTPLAAPAATNESRLRALEIIREYGIQAHMPGTVEEESAPAEDAAPPPEPPPEQKALLDLPDWAVETLLWVAVIGGLASILWSLRDYFPAFQRQRHDFLPLDETPEDSAAPSRKLEAAQDEADELAGQGRFVEAMHLLLLRSVAEMRRRLDIAFADSLTSREIVNRSSAPADAKVALREIIQWVERAYFGDHPADRNDYDACRRSFVALRGILRADGRE